MSTDELPDLIRSRVGPQVVTMMAEALDAVIAANVHDLGCRQFLADDRWRICQADCPTGIATHAVRQIALLTNLAVVGG